MAKAVKVMTIDSAHTSSMGLFEVLNTNRTSVLEIPVDYGRLRWLGLAKTVEVMITYSIPLYYTVPYYQGKASAKSVVMTSTAMGTNFYRNLPYSTIIPKAYVGFVSSTPINQLALSLSGIFVDLCSTSGVVKYNT